MIRVLQGDCREVMSSMEADSVDSIVTDPPAGIGFMGKEWDHDKGGRDSWIAWMTLVATEALRVLKPGGHALVWAIPRTSHWTAMAWENAGFVVRDRVSHLFGSGFPKSLDVSKAIDKARDDRPDILRVTSFMADAAERAGITRADIDAAMGTSDMGGWWLSRLAHRCQCPKWDQWLQLKVLLSLGDDMDAEVWRLNGRKGTPGEAWDKREKLGERAVPMGHAFAGSTYGGDSSNKITDITAPATDAARQWQGWGTALKPAMEDWWLLRKPLIGTVAANVIRFGTGALNIDACRIATEDSDSREGGGGEARRRGPCADDLRGMWLRDDEVALPSEASKAANGVQRAVPVKGDDRSGQSSVDGWGLDGRQEWLPLAQDGPAFSAGSGASAQCELAANAGTSSCDGEAYGSASPKGGDGSSRQRREDRQPVGEPAPDGLVAAFEGASAHRTRVDGSEGGERSPARAPTPLGRWPANVLTDGSDEVLAAFPQTTSGSWTGQMTGRGSKTSGDWGKKDREFHWQGDSGSAARFFYTAKASAYDRNDGTYDLPRVTTDDGRQTSIDNPYLRGETKRGNHHPTVKPTDLMRYLCRLVTPPGGTVLDPFAGSGSTLKAAELEGFSAIGIELDPNYVAIAQRRISSDAPLFASVEVA